MILKIDPAFRDFLPKIGDEEYRLLEEDIVAQGRCINPITINGSSRVIYDGHNRYKICKKHGIPFEVITKSFTSKAEAFLWIAEHQTGRRNMDIGVSIELAKKIVDYEIEAANAQREAGGKKPLQRSPFDVNQAIADKVGVSKKTVCRYIKTGPDKTMDDHMAEFNAALNPDMEFVEISCDDELDDELDGGADENKTENKTENETGEVSAAAAGSEPAAEPEDEPEKEGVSLLINTRETLVDMSKTHDKNGKTYLDNAAAKVVQLARLHLFAEDSAHLSDKSGDKKAINKKLMECLARVEEILADGELV